MEYNANEVTDESTIFRGWSEIFILYYYEIYDYFKLMQLY